MSKNIRDLRQTMRSILAVCAITGCLAVSATEYFVSKERPDDSGDGLTVETAKRTIQAAVDLAKNGDVVTVLPGIYDEGEGSYYSATEVAETRARVVLTNQVHLRSFAGREKTFIKGLRTDLGEEKDLRCIALGIQSAIVEGFTLCGGGTKWGGGVLAESWHKYFICDCVISNNVARDGAGAYRGTLIGCLVTDNTASNRGGAIFQANAHNTIICHNSNPKSHIAYCKTLVNCSIFENELTGSSSSSQYSELKLYNCLIFGNAGNFGDPGYSIAKNCVTDRSSSEFKEPVDCKFESTGHNLVASPFKDFRLLENAPAVGAGNAEFLTKISFENGIKGWTEYLEEKYRYKDFKGQDIAESGAVNCGAVQETFNPTGGCVVFLGDTGAYLTTSAGRLPLTSRGSYAYAETYPTQWSVKATFSSGKPLFKYEITPAYTKQLCHYPEFDETFRFAPPPQDVEVTNHVYASHDVYYVNASSLAENPDGLTPETAFTTIQDAVDVASSEYSRRSYISVAPGVYDKGGVIDYGISNRVAVNRKTVRIVSTHGAERTFIVGAPDPATGGYGPNAVRCVSWYHSGRVGGLQGFTLTGGYTGITPEGVNQFTTSAAAGGYYGSCEHVLDCIITNNHAHWASATKSGYFFRCLIADNTTVHQGTVWMSELMSCIVRDNVVGYEVTPSVLWNSTVARFCTVDGAIGSKTLLYASILLGNHHVTSNCRLDNSIICGADLAEGVTVENCLFKDPCIAGTDDWRILSCSPAIAHADLADLRDHLSYTSGDYSGRPLRFSSDGLMTAGACQWPVQAVSVAVSRGGPQPLTVTGGTVGTNALENAATITVTAQKKSDAGRRFLGFTVDGVDYPADQLTCTVTQSGEPSGCISIIANYSSVPMAVILR